MVQLDRLTLRYGQARQPTGQSDSLLGLDAVLARNGLTSTYSISLSSSWIRPSSPRYSRYESKSVTISFGIGCPLLQLAGVGAIVYGVFSVNLRVRNIRWPINRRPYRLPHALGIAGFRT